MNSRLSRWMVLSVILCVFFAFSSGADSLPAGMTVKKPQQDTNHEQEMEALRKTAELCRKSLGWAYVAAGGEIIFSGTRIDPPDDALHVLPDGDGLQLVRAWPPGSHPYARVAADGTIALDASEEAQERPFTPRKWPLKKEQKRLELPDGGTVLSRENEEKGAHKVRAPRNAVGWAFESADGTLVLNPKLKPFGDPLWFIRRADGGMDVKRKSQKGSAVYATITKEGSVVAGSGNLSSSPEKTWRITDTHGLPSLPKMPLRLNPNLTNSLEMTVSEDGEVVSRKVYAPSAE